MFEKVLFWFKTSTINENVKFHIIYLTKNIYVSNNYAMKKSSLLFSNFFRCFFSLFAEAWKKIGWVYFEKILKREWKKYFFLLYCLLSTNENIHMFFCCCCKRKSFLSTELTCQDESKMRKWNKKEKINVCGRKRTQRKNRWIKLFPNYEEREREGEKKKWNQHEKRVWERRMDGVWKNIRWKSKQSVFSSSHGSSLFSLASLTLKSQESLNLDVNFFFACFSIISLSRCDIISSQKITAKSHSFLPTTF